MSFEEADAGLRRRYLIFIAEQLSERDRLLDQLMERIRQISGADLAQEDIALLSQMREIDGLLMQSRFTRILSNATWFDHVVANVVGYARARPLAFVVSILNFSIFGAFSYLVATGRIFPDLSVAFDRIIWIESAHAATFDLSNPGNIRIVLLLGIAILLAVVFLFFAGAACLSTNGDTRDWSRKFMWHMSTFLLGIIAGYFSHPG